MIRTPGGQGRIGHLSNPSKNPKRDPGYKATVSQETMGGGSDNTRNKGVSRPPTAAERAGMRAQGAASKAQRPR